MKKTFIMTAIAVLLAVASATAQQIAVVSEGGETSVYQTFQAAIEGADPGSVIYLPGGSFPISDDVKITQKITIIGIGHKIDGENVDGITTISGNIWFNEGSSCSAIIGCYITGNVIIGANDAEVNNIFIKCCNLNAVQIMNNHCNETIVNQNYIRSTSDFGGSNGQISNNIISSLKNMQNGKISYNIFLNYYRVPSGYSYNEYCVSVSTSTIHNNVFIPGDHYSSSWVHLIISGNDNIIYSNLYKKEVSLEEEPLNVNNADWNDVFVNFNNGSISPNSNFHFKEDYIQYENQVGVYANGVDFDKQIAPVPYIVAKRIDQETDAAGRLKIQVRVKSGAGE